MTDLFDLEAYRYALPQELIAQYPVEPRDASRLLIVDRKKCTFSEIKFCELKDFLTCDDGLIFNDTKVIPARLIGHRLPGGGKTEIFLLKRLSNDEWQVLARPGKKLKAGSEVVFLDDFKCEILENSSDEIRVVRFKWKGNFEDLLSTCGHLPLPHYIQRSKEKQSSDEEKRYQTVYASSTGALAAPTAGLHFTKNLLNDLKAKKVAQHYLTLHVGLGTFKPVQTTDIRQHQMHTEEFTIDEETAFELNQSKPFAKQIVVGTTTCRALESKANSEGFITAGHGTTNIFIYPGFQFKYAQALLTNFHLPCSSLLMLVCAFGGYELIMEAYYKAIKERFRFYSFGDAMLIL